MYCNFDLRILLGMLNFLYIFTSRANGATLGEKEFYTRRSVIFNVVYPTVKAYSLASEGSDLRDSLQRELAVRERANRVGILQVNSITVLNDLTLLIY